MAATDVIPVLQSVAKGSDPLVPGGCARESGPLVPRDSVSGLGFVWHGSSMFFL